MDQQRAFFSFGSQQGGLLFFHPGWNGTYPAARRTGRTPHPQLENRTSTTRLFMDLRDSPHYAATREKGVRLELVDSWGKWMEPGSSPRTGGSLAGGCSSYGHRLGPEPGCPAVSLTARGVSKGLGEPGLDQHRPGGLTFNTWMPPGTRGESSGQPSGLLLTIRPRDKTQKAPRTLSAERLGDLGSAVWTAVGTGLESEGNRSSLQQDSKLVAVRPAWGTRTREPAAAAAFPSFGRPQCLAREVQWPPETFPAPGAAASSRWEPEPPPAWSRGNQGNSEEADLWESLFERGGSLVTGAGRTYGNSD